MAVKKSAQTLREELRVLNSAADDVPGVKLGNDWLTPEFWTMVVSGLANLVTVAVVFGWVSASDAESLTKAVTAIVGASQVIVINAVLVWKFIASRVAVKEALIDARFRYMEAVAVERIRSEKE